jgi:hypothetical protein
MMNQSVGKKAEDNLFPGRRMRCIGSVYQKEEAGDAYTAE